MTWALDTDEHHWTSWIKSSVSKWQSGWISSPGRISFFCGVWIHGIWSNEWCRIYVKLYTWELVKDVQITCAANASLSVVAVIYGKITNSWSSQRWDPILCLLLNLANTNLRRIHHLPQFFHKFCLIVLLSQQCSQLMTCTPPPQV